MVPGAGPAGSLPRPAQAASLALPKTRSGKIMRRILRKIAEAGPDGVDRAGLGDTSTLADPGVVDSLVNERQGR